MATKTTTISLGNPEQEAIDLKKQLDPLYVQNFRMSMEAVAPGSSQTVSENISSMLQGKIPLDVQRQLIQTSAELNLTQGRFGEAANFSTMRNLGKASMDIQQQGLANLKSMMPQLPDIATLIQNQRAFDVQRAQMQLQESQFARQQTQQLQEFQASSALDKLRLSLAQQQQAFTQQMETKTFDWNKQISAYNEQYQAYRDQQNMQLAQQLLAASKAETQTRQNVADQTAQKGLSTLANMRKPSGTSSLGFTNKVSTDGTVTSGMGEAPPPYTIPGGGEKAATPGKAITAEDLFGTDLYQSLSPQMQQAAQSAFGVYDPSAIDLDNFDSTLTTTRSDKSYGMGGSW